MLSTSNRFFVNATWLLKLRWLALFGQVLTIGFVTWGLNIQLLLAPLVVVVGVTAISNIVLSVWFYREFRRPPGPGDEQFWNIVLALVMIMDMLSLTALLYAAGGLTNPFWLFFFVNLSLAGTVLSRFWAWTLHALSVACFAFLIYDYVILPELYLEPWLEPVRQSGLITLPQIGLFIAFNACATVIVYFVTRLNGELRQQEVDLRLAQEQRARSEKLEALGTLAAGAAHELATPLSTIAVIANDVQHELRQADVDDPQLIDDVHQIRAQLDRCRKILDRMSIDAGQTVGEKNRPITMAELLDEVLGDIDHRDRVECDLAPAAENALVEVPIGGLSQAIRGLVQNGLDAIGDDGRVRIEIRPRDERWQWTIRDDGPGIPTDIQHRLSEPFFTTKSPGQGMGLGVFLAKNVIEKLGGTLEIRSALGQGTSAVIMLPGEPTS